MVTRRTNSTNLKTRSKDMSNDKMDEKGISVSTDTMLQEIEEISSFLSIKCFFLFLSFLLLLLLLLNQQRRIIRNIKIKLIHEIFCVNVFPSERDNRYNCLVL